MPLIKYSQYVYYPGGGPAAFVDLKVMLTGGNVAVPLLADKAGTSPLPNPVTTDAEGLVTFYAPPGDYSVWLGGAAWPLLVDDTETDPAWPGTFVHEQTTPAVSWSVAHHFGTEPSVDVITDDVETKGEVSHPDDEHTVITFGSPTTGVARLRR